MADVGDKVSVASKSGPRLGVVMSTSGSMLRVRWESGEETGLIPGPGTLTVVGKTRKRSSGAAKAAKAAKVKPGRAAAKSPANAKAKTPATKKATARMTPSKKKAGPKKSVASTPGKRASKSSNKKAAVAKSPSKKKSPAKKSGPKAR